MGYTVSKLTVIWHLPSFRERRCVCLVPPREFSQSLVPGGIAHMHSGFKPAFTRSVLHESKDWVWLCALLEAGAQATLLWGAVHWRSSASYVGSYTLGIPPDQKDNLSGVPLEHPPLCHSGAPCHVLRVGCPSGWLSLSSPPLFYTLLGTFPFLFSGTYHFGLIFCRAGVGWTEFEALKDNDFFIYLFISGPKRVCCLATLPIRRSTARRCGNCFQDQTCQCGGKKNQKFQVAVL